MFCCRPVARSSTMPLIRVHTSAAAPANAGPLLQELSHQLASLLGKPERYVMTSLQAGLAMTFGGDPAPACYVEVKSIGALDAARIARLCSVLCDLLHSQLGVPPDRTYISFEDVAPQLWGWDGRSFA
jgi:phenylpyruvate tautomerase